MEQQPSRQGFDDTYGQAPYAPPPGGGFEEPRASRDTTVREPDGLIVPTSAVNGSRGRGTPNEERDEGDSEPQTRTEGIDFDTINFAELDLFADAGTTKLAIPNSDFHIIVKNELDFGEQATLDSISIRGIQRTDLDGMDSNSMVVLDVAKQRLYNLAMYIVGWNFTTKRGDTVRLPRTLEERVKLFRRMNAIVGQQLTNMIQKHIDTQAEQMKRVEAAEEHRMGIMAPVDEEDRGAPKLSRSGASAT